MPSRGHKATTTGPLRTHSRSSSATRMGAANLQFTQKDLARAGDKAKKAFDGARPGLGSRTNSSQRIPQHQQTKRTMTTTKNGAAQHKNGKIKGGGQVYQVIATESDGDEDEWVSSESGAQTPNAELPSGSDTASEGDVIPQLSQQLHRLQMEQQQVQEQQVQQDYQELRQDWSHPPLARADTARQSQYTVPPPKPTTMNQNQNQNHAPPPPPAPAVAPPLITRSQSAVHLGDRQHTERSQTEQSNQRPASDHGDTQPTHRRKGSRQNGVSHNHHHHPNRPSVPAAASETPSTTTATTAPALLPTKQASLIRAPSSHSISSRSDIVRPHPLIRGYSQGHIHHALKHTPLAPLAAITDKSFPTEDDDDQQHHHLSISPASVRTSIASPTSQTHDSDHSQEVGGGRDRNGRRTSFSSVRSVSTLPAYTHTQATATFVPATPTNASNNTPGHAFPSSATLATASAAPLRSSYTDRDRSRTLSMLSTASSAALSSLVHLPNATRPPSPQGPQPVSFFPPVNPHLNTEAIHPLLPGPYLTNHLTILAKRTPLRESYDRVIRAKIASGR